MVISESYRKRLRELAGIDPTDAVIIPAGKKLFHGTMEDFDIKDARPGGYDRVFWTTEFPAISQTYIPVQGLSTLVSTGLLSNAPKQKDIASKQKQMGIEYTNVEKDSHGDVKSSTPPKVFSDFYEIHKEAWDKFWRLKNESEKFEDEISDMSGEERAAAIKRALVLRKELEQAEKDYTSSDVDKKRNKYVNDFLKSLGYEPRQRSDYDLNHRWKLKIKSDKYGNETILPADFREQGRLLIVTPKEDMKIYDMTYGETLEPSLLNPQYHMLDTFRSIEEAGYDGVKITDHAQIEDVGNYGHISIGFFGNSMPKLDIKETPAQHPSGFHGRHSMTRDYDTDEYKNYLNQTK